MAFGVLYWQAWQPVRATIHAGKALPLSVQPLNYLCCVICLVCRDNNASSFTAVRTIGLSGEASSPVGSPRVSKTPSNLQSSGGGNSPLLKAALNANLNRIHAVSPVASSSGGSPVPQPASSNGSTSSNVSTNVKQRLREYFVARNPEVVVNGEQAGQRAQSCILPSKSQLLQEQDLGQGVEQQ